MFDLFFKKVLRIYVGERVILLINDVGEIVYLNVKEWNLIFSFYYLKN